MLELRISGSPSYFVYLNFPRGGAYTHEIFWKKRSGKVLVLPAQNGRLER